MCIFFLPLHAQQKALKEAQGAIQRMDTTQKKLYLTFTGHEFGEGSEVILQTLKTHKVKASFFFTGDFYRNPTYSKIIRQLRRDGHYLGMHSDKHLLYCDWTKRDSLLVTKVQFEKDIRDNRAALTKMGVPSHQASFFMPPYEWYNAKINQWAQAMGLTLVNFTPGTGTNADYTTPDMPNYRSSVQLYERLLQFEKTHPNHLNGAILLIHFGTDPKRTDKFYTYLPRLIEELKGKGYVFGRF
jgi:peptidoglycan/xylan/chitin deacetylase (PgdA/CDA1 family)